MIEPESQNCRAFLEAWNSGQNPSIEDFLPASESQSRQRVLLEMVVLDAKLRVSQEGLADGGVDELVEKYASAFEDFSTPNLRNDLRKRLSELLANFGLETLLESSEESVEHSASGFDSTEQASRYALIAEHARGGMGVIWRVKDRKLGREIALKKLAPQLAEDESTRERFVAEARVTAQLEHPGIVPIYDLTEIESGEPSYTMKLLRGETMTAAIERFHCMDANDVERNVLRNRLVEAFLSVCRTIAFAHRNNVLHRDIKPDNILIGDFGETAVLDWGLAKADVFTQPADEVPEPSGADVVSGSELEHGSWSADATQQGALLGTPFYMSPEQARGEATSEASDCYGLGAVLYQLLTGRPPLNADSLDKLLKAVIHDEPSKPSLIAKNTPKPLEAICLKLLRKRPEERYLHAHQIVSDLEKYLADEPVSCARESWVDRSFRWMRKNKTYVVLGVSGLLLAAVVTTSFVLISKANQSTQFASLQRIQQARSAAETADAVASEQISNDDFAGAAEVLAAAISQIESIDELETLSSQLRRKHARISMLAKFDELFAQLYHLALTKEVDLAYRNARQCLVSLGIEDQNENWVSAIPIEDLSEQQRFRLKEQIHGVFLHLAVTQTNAGFTEFVRFNSQASIFTVKTNDRIKSKIDQGAVYLDRADSYRKTTAARYLRLIVELGAGELSLVEWMSKWSALAPEEPQSAVDCYYTAMIYGMSEVLNKYMGVFVAAAQLKGSNSKMADSKFEASRLLQKANRLDPGFYPALYLRGRQVASEGNHKAALATFTDCLKIAPNAAEAFTARAMAVLVQSLLTDKEDWKPELRKQFEEDIVAALQIAPDNGHVRFEVGSLQCFDQQVEAGIENILVGLDLNSDRLLDSMKHDVSLDPDEVVKSMSLTTDFSSHESKLKLLKATLFSDRGNHQRAWSELSDFPVDDPYKHRAAVIKAICASKLVKGEQWERLQPGLTSEQVLQWVEGALESHPQEYRNWHTTIELLRKLEDSEKALKTTRQALSASVGVKDWQRFELLWIQGELLRELEQTAEAEKSFEAARKLSEIYFEFFADQSEVKP